MGAATGKWVRNDNAHSETSRIKEHAFTRKEHEDDEHEDDNFCPFFVASTFFWQQLMNKIRL